MSCKYCDEIVNKIKNAHPKASWNCDDACHMWHELSANIPDSKIKYEPYSDFCYSCNCPNCGEMICGWCV